MTDNMKKSVINILMVICLLVALGCGGYLIYYYYTSHKSESNIEDLRGMITDSKVEGSTENASGVDDDNPSGKPEPDMVEIDGVKVQKKFEELYRANHDFVGWIKIDDTNVDYPVMYTPNDNERGEHYIHLDFDEKYSASGLPFIDRNCDLKLPTDNTIIYGHNMNSGKMFHDILKYENEDFYSTHKTFTFDTIYGDGEYEVVAMFYAQILPDASKDFKYYQFVNAGSNEEFMNYIDNIKSMSIIDTGVDVKFGDKLVTLSTCAYHVDDGRFAVIAKKIDDTMD